MRVSGRVSGPQSGVPIWREVVRKTDVSEEKEALWEVLTTKTS